MLDEWQNKNIANTQLTITNREKQLIIGTLLGNSSIIKPKKSKNPHFQMRESITKGGTWIRCKAYELQRFSRSKSFVADKDSFRWNSISSTCWNEFYNLCYKGNKKHISMDWLDMLQDFGLACWFMDKGQVSKKYASLRISRLDKKSIENIKNYFEIIGIPGEIKTFGGSKIIAFKDKNKIRFMHLIGQKLPLYKRIEFS